MLCWVKPSTVWLLRLRQVCGSVWFGDWRPNTSGIGAGYRLDDTVSIALRKAGRMCCIDKGPGFVLGNGDTSDGPWPPTELQSQISLTALPRLVSAGQPLEALALMSSCRHFLLTSGSFGWWGAYMGERPNSTIITCGEYRCAATGCIACCVDLPREPSALTGHARGICCCPTRGEGRRSFTRDVHLTYTARNPHIPPRSTLAQPTQAMGGGSHDDWTSSDLDLLFLIPAMRIDPSGGMGIYTNTSTKKTLKDKLSLPTFYSYFLAISKNKVETSETYTVWAGRRAT